MAVAIMSLDDAMVYPIPIRVYNLDPRKNGSAVFIVINGDLGTMP
jgi:hypothetical protein